MGGCCVKPTPDPAVGRSSQRYSSKRNLRLSRAPHRTWWSTSSDEMENNITNSRSSQRSTSSISGISHNQENRSGSSNANDAAFVNHALLLWNERRREWVGNRPQQRPHEEREPVISYMTTYDDLLSTSRPFPRHIPLPEMVVFLVDVWQQDGLYD